MTKNIIFVVLLLVVSTHAQIKTFRWNSELCDHVGTYDSKKYSETQLRNTLKLMDYSASSLSKYPSVWKWEDINALDLAALDAEYKKKAADLMALDVIKTAYFENAKIAQIKELEQKYKFSRTQLLAYKTPEILRDYAEAESCKVKYAEPLIKKDETLLKVWLDVNMDSRSKNGDPNRLKRIFDEQMTSPDRIKYAIVEVMGFGWGNCVNAFIERDEGASNGEHEKAFRKLFKRVRENCSES